MRKTALKLLAALMICLSVMCFAACDESPEEEAGISIEQAESLMQSYLEDKGFAEGDFLAEGGVMVLDGEKVYSFSWRTKAGENADRLFGIYAVSFDGKNFYEYQSARDEWIKDMGEE